MNLVVPVGHNLVAASSRYLVYTAVRAADNFTNKFGCRLTVKNARLGVVKNSLRSW